ncbi:RNA-binding S4 domain-containing protein [Cognatazoarcus halotolerans]|uniref:RNA-binding S4 domain-containing protein n=1 Tax=Cognatazoarcus halotolerans TaxID=2686016 RepID=UPI001F414F48|nr:RNA-binding S4 domain-containing protein [Cognatazoarcus halotolerans]
MRLDKWLWAARFFKTRSLASAQIDAGRVTVNGVKAKRATSVMPGDEISLPVGGEPRSLILLALSALRGPAAVAQQLYRETIESATNRATLAELRRFAPEPEQSRHGRPTKQDRRRIQRLRDS